MEATTEHKSSSKTGPENSGSSIVPSYTLNNYYSLKYFSNNSISSLDLPVYLKYTSVCSSTGKNPIVAPYSGAIFDTVALSAKVKF